MQLKLERIFINTLYSWLYYLLFELHKTLISCFKLTFILLRIRFLKTAT
jgi:hypothetical protein